MMDKQYDQLNEQTFDLYLEEIVDYPPPADLSKWIYTMMMPETLWQKSKWRNRILYCLRL